MSLQVRPRPIRIALMGNPNSGKTTLFNALTGASYKVANYPGATVEKKEGSLRLDCLGQEALIVDLPGTYSLFGHSADEVVATSVIAHAKKAESPVDVLVAVIDAGNLERNLYFLTQLIDCGLPVVAALTMLDLAERRGLKVFSELLSRQLDVPFVKVRAREGKGLDELNHQIVEAALHPRLSRKRFAWLDASPAFNESVDRLALQVAEGFISEDPSTLPLAALSLLSGSVEPGNERQHDACNKERQELFARGIDPYTKEAQARFEYVQELLKHAVAHTEVTKGHDISVRLDRVLTHKVWGTLIFVLTMGLLFQSVFTLAGLPMQIIDAAITALSSFVSAALPPGALRSLLVDGMIAGVGSVVVFIPQIAILFFFIALLEDTGYLTRASYLMDRFMSLVGLQGRCFIPLLNSFACAVPGIMSARIIPSRSARLTTILIAPLMSCSARIPVYALLIAAFVPEYEVLPFVSLQGLTMLGLYLLGFLLAGAVAFVLNRTLVKKTKSYFVMEMPDYHIPSMRVVCSEVRDRIKAFLKTAGGIILFCSVLLWYLASHPAADPPVSPAEQIRQSYAGELGAFIEPALRPLGLNWEAGIALISSFAAREVFVSTMATVYNLQEQGAGAKSLVSILKAKRDRGEFPLSTALPLLVFFVVACQCSSTLATCKHETNSWKWASFLFLYTLVLAYSLAWGLRMALLWAVPGP